MARTLSREAVYGLLYGLTWTRKIYSVKITDPPPETLKLEPPDIGMDFISQSSYRGGTIYHGVFDLAHEVRKTAKWESEMDKLIAAVFPKFLFAAKAVEIHFFDGSTLLITLA